MKKIPAYCITTAVFMGLLAGMSACTVSYNFRGVNIDDAVETYSVDYFPNRAPLVQAQLSQLFTDALIDRIEANTGLTMTTGAGDVSFSGEIRNYQTRPTAITGQETAARNRLTIAVRVKYVNDANPELDYDTEFSRYEDYDASLNLSDVEDELIEVIVGYLIDDIFNQAFVNW